MIMSPTSLTKYIQAAYSAGCPRDQLLSFRQADYLAQPKQLLFHALCRECDEPGGPTEVAFGGARGPGKSHALLAQIALDDCQRLPGCKALLLRRVGRAVKESFEDLRQSVLRVPHAYRRSDGVVDFPNSSKIILGHFHNESDVDRYLGLQYDVIGIEECTTLSNVKYKAVRTCNRTSKTGWIPRVYSNANPGGVGHSWYKRRFILEPGQPRFIAATYKDNAFLNPGYVDTLNDLTGWLKRAWMYGDWDIAAGQYYSTFNAKVHVIEPRPVSSWWDVWLSLDTGWVHPTAAMLFTKDPVGGVVVIDEYQASRRLPLAHCNQFQSMLDRWGIKRERIQSVVTGQDAWAKDREGRAVADTYEESGWPLERANMARVQGAKEILRRLGDIDSGIDPSLHIYSTCVDLIGLLPALQHDPRQPEDILKQNADDEGLDGDDLADALRYGIMYASTSHQLEYGVLSVPR